MQIPIAEISQESMHAHNLHDKVYPGHICCEIHRGMYGLPQAGKVANNLLKKTSIRIWLPQKTLHSRMMEHSILPVHFILVVDDVGIKFVGKEHLQYLINILKMYYEIDVDYASNKYCGVTLD